MARNKGMFQFAANFEIKNAAALDPRMVVATKAELYNKETWPYDGETAYLYNGLVVAVTEENELYMLIDAANFALESSWKKISVSSDDLGPSIVVEDSLTSTSVENALSANQGKVLKDMIDALPAYEIEKTESGYKLVTETGGEALGEVISFSDLVVKSGEVVDVDGSLCIRLTLTNDEVIDIPAVSLVDVYTAGDSYINISDDNKISLNVDVLKSNLGIPKDLSEEVAGLVATIGNAESGLVKSVNDHESHIKNLETVVSGKADQSALTVLEGVISSNTDSVQTLETAVGENTEKIEVLEGKVDVSKVSTAIAEAIAPFRIKGLVAGENIEIVETADSGIFKIGVTNITADDILYEEGISVKTKLDALSDVIDSAGSGGLLGITGGPGISVNTSTSTTMPTVGVKVKADSALVADEDGLDIIWKEFLS